MHLHGNPTRDGRLQILASPARHQALRRIGTVNDQDFQPALCDIARNGTTQAVPRRWPTAPAGSWRCPWSSLVRRPIPFRAAASLREPPPNPNARSRSRRISAPSPHLPVIARSVAAWPVRVAVNAAPNHCFRAIRPITQSNLKGRPTGSPPLEEPALLRIVISRAAFEIPIH